MNKANIVRSSEFHMDTGDILHYILIVDSGAIPTINVVSLSTTSNEEEVPDAVVALDASDITSSSFTANWNFIENAQSYYLDVATDSAFTAFVAGYNNLSVGAVNEYPVVGLLDAYTYYYRVRASNDYGTGDSSNTITLTTLNAVLTDYDGNVYTYVTIGTQQWLIDNFKSTHYADGTVIANLTLNADWIADGTGAYCWYNNDIANKADYGALYNWFAIDNAHGFAYIEKDGILDATWHVPSDADLITLQTFVGGYLTAGGKFKEIGLTYWNTPNTGATNEYGFNLRGAGYRNDGTGTFAEKKTYTSLWSTTDGTPATEARDRYIRNSEEAFYPSEEDKNFGFSVRLMRDI